ncbi:MAG TPA: hypothetical protein DIV86_06640 [Alphaproteobacteria bacterium]|nr:hypothetical protein [Alphaproteobacteria bacterium]
MLVDLYLLYNKKHLYIKGNTTLAQKNNILKMNEVSKINNLQKKTLLPYGFHDHIFGEAEAELDINNVILSSLKKSGFKLIRPSTIEFEESLDSEYSPNFFKVSDPISGKMMVLRADITPQIARIIRDKFSEKYFNNETVKISYTGQVFRKNPIANSSERQLTQTGFEILSNDNINSDVFTILQAISTFKKLKTSDYTINFVYPALLDKILANSKNIDKVKELIEVKDYLALEKLNPVAYKLCRISDEVFDLKSAVKVIGEIEKIAGDKKLVRDDLQKIKKIITQFLATSSSNISFDLFESYGFTYHSGLCYSFISNKTHEEIGRGGRYDILSENGSISAVGFTFLVNSINRTSKNNAGSRKK